MIAFSRMLIVCQASFSLSLLSPNDNPHLPRMLHNNVIRFCVYMRESVCVCVNIVRWVRLSWSWATFSSLFLFSICKLDCYYLPTSIRLILMLYIELFHNIVAFFFLSCFVVFLIIVSKKVMLSLCKHHPNFDSIFSNLMIDFRT